MKKTAIEKIFLSVLLLSSFGLFGGMDSAKPAPGEYILVVEGFDWGPAVSKVIVQLDTVMSSVEFRDFSVIAERSSDCADIPAASKIGDRAIAYAFVSDKEGKRVSQGNYATLVLAVAPNMPLSSPFQYSRSGKCRGNSWVDYKLTITNTKSNAVWNKQRGRIIPLIDEFDLTGRFDYEEGKTMSYAFFEPKAKSEKAPLIIWLHGGGEGGTDPTIPLLGNKAANYASEDIQQFFGGAYVLVPQCPGAWMHNEQGVTTHGKEDDVYNKGLLALIKDFVNAHPGIDKKRIYVGGCSNGSYMALKLMLVDPGYFAAAYISALAYQSQYITDQQIKSVQNIPMWFVHSKDDPTTIPDKTVVPVYQRLKAAGAKNVHFSFYDRVTDLSGFFGGENYYYNGHWSWIYSHVNHAKQDYDGKPMLLKGKPVTIMEWMAAQTKQ